VLEVDGFFPGLESARNRIDWALLTPTGPCELDPGRSSVRRIGDDQTRVTLAYFVGTEDTVYLVQEPGEPLGDPSDEWAVRAAGDFTAFVRHTDDELVAVFESSANAADGSPIVVTVRSATVSESQALDFVARLTIE
jgi:hypothetical protein